MKQTKNVVYSESQPSIQSLILQNHKVRKITKPTTTPTSLVVEVPIFTANKQDELTLFVPQPQLSAIVEKYDRECYLNRNWVFKINEKKKTQQNPIVIIYSFLYYLDSRHQLLLLSEVRYIDRYDEPACEIKDTACLLYEKLGITEYFEPNNYILHLLLWCIYSMHTYGIIRPLIFEFESDPSDQFKNMCAYKFKRGKRKYLTMWPFRTDDENIIIIHNNSKENKHQIQSLLKEKNIKSKTNLTIEQLQAKIPKWIYQIHNLLSSKK